MSDITEGDHVRIVLPPNDSCYDEYNGVTGVAVRPTGNGILVCTSQGSIVVSKHELVRVPKPEDAVPTRKDFRYTLELDQTGYVELMQLIFKHGLSHENGYKLSQHTVDAVSGAEISYH